MLVVAVAVVMALAGASTDAARAAVFTLVPSQTYYTDGTGPFAWSFASGQSGEYDWVGYKLSTEAAWHRCQAIHSASLASLPEGVYAVDIADDVDRNWLAAHGGLGGSSDTCGNGQPPDNPISEDRIVVDLTPPTVTVPKVIVDGKTAQISLSASDALSGVGTYTWSFGDGTGQQTSSGSVITLYPSYRTYYGTVTVSDRAGNTSAQPFSVTTQDPAASSTPGSLRTLPLRIDLARAKGRKLRFLASVPGEVHAPMEFIVKLKGRRPMWTATRRVAPAGGRLALSLRLPVAPRRWKRASITIAFFGDATFAPLTKTTAFRP